MYFFVLKCILHTFWIKKAITDTELIELFMDLFLSTAVCEGFVENVIAEYYEPVLVDGKISCVTVCDSLHSRPKMCYSKGHCRVYRDTGPVCE